MIASVFSLILFMFCITGIVYYPKTTSRINGVKTFTVGVTLVVCLEAAAGILFYYMHIRVGCVSMSAVLMLCAVILWCGIWRKKRVQKVFWRKLDVIGILSLTIFVCLITVYVFGIELNLQYPNIWAADNFARAMCVVRGQVIENVGFATVIEALFIQVFSPFFLQEMSYKGYMLAVLFLLLVEVWLFYVVVISISQKKIVHILALIFTVAYVWGYPAYNYMIGNDDSFSICSIWILLMVYVLCLLMRRSDQNRKMLFVYRTLLAVFTVSVIIVTFMRSFTGVTDGREIYSSMYGDLVFFVPVTIYVCYRAFFDEKKRGAVCIMSIAMIGCVLTLYRFWYDGVISNYDYYQNYAVLWLLGWLLAVQALDFSIENRELSQFFAYAGFIGTLALLVLSGFANRVSMGLGDSLYVTKCFFSLYRNNEECLFTDYEEYRIEEDVLKIYGEVISNYGEKDTSILTGEVREQIWFDALTDNDSALYNMGKYELPELLKKLDENGVQMIVVQKNKNEYQMYKNYFDGCDVVCENEMAVLYKVPQNGWMDVSRMNLAEHEEKMELYRYVKNELSEEQIPLMATKESYLDYLLYENVTGNSSSEFYTWKYNPRDNIVNLNAHDVKYVVLLQKDAYYLESNEYYDAQEIIYENATGKIVHCVGENWSVGE